MASANCLKFLRKRVEGAELKAAIQAAERREARDEFFDYNRELNTQGETGATSGRGEKASFGSGSIPNE